MTVFITCGSCQTINVEGNYSWPKCKICGNNLTSLQPVQVPDLLLPWEVGFGNPARPYIIAITQLQQMHEFQQLYFDPRNTITGGNPTGGGPFFRAGQHPVLPKYIVHSANSHDHLVKSLDGAVSILKDLFDSGYIHPDELSNRDREYFNTATKVLNDEQLFHQ